MASVDDQIPSSKISKIISVSKQKWRNRTLQRGVVIDKAWGYVYVRFKHQQSARKELIGRTSEPDVIDKANFRAQQIRHDRRAHVPGFEARKERLLMEDAADLFLKLHGEKRQSRKGVKQFVRYVRLMKKAWSARYADTLTGDDMRDYRTHRHKEGVAESTINREQTAIYHHVQKNGGMEADRADTEERAFARNKPRKRHPKSQ